MNKHSSVFLLLVRQKLKWALICIAAIPVVSLSVYKLFFLNREHDLHAAFKVTRHPVCTTAVELLITTVFKIEYPAVLKEVSDDGSDGDILAHTLYACS